MTRLTRTCAALMFLGCCCLTARAAAPEAKQYYDLRFRPVSGLKFAYDQTLRSEMKVTVSPPIRGKSRSEQKYHRQIIVDCEQITGIRNGLPVSKRITYGPNCWTATKEDDKPTHKAALVQAEKTVNFSIGADGSVQQDIGVKPTREEAQAIRNSMAGGSELLPTKAVAIGDRWRGDEGLRAVLDLKSTDTVSGILTLKAVRQQEGREVADLGVTAAIITKQSGFHVEMNVEGTVTMDVQTGMMIGTHLTGTSTISGGPVKGRGGASAGRGQPAPQINVSGTGTLELHQSGRFVTSAATADVAS